ncbi:hypothetical protein D5400_03025 [Georhizobium profundi]|uniref:Uncharacterized protein n=1 Tax=Georhizobium profundi TaxID=2341112 RepID=A0A3Q8XNY1_9HYPH|nr:hypothetical protein [Georhizobium profundi]AZN70385.1 hypothetical protein D5400_03025 [Georhizobium profundi]
MNRFFLFFLRLLMMAFAFFVACIVTGATLAFLTRAVTPEDVRNITGDGTWISVMIGVLTVAGLVAYASLIPAMFIALYSEMQRRRGWLFYCLSGGVVAALCLAFLLLNPQQDGNPSISFVAVIIVSGMLGGLAYWVIAGRHAGGWLPRQIKRRRMEREAASRTAE